MPKNGRRKSLIFRKSSIITFNSLIGIIKPIFCAFGAYIVLIPITCPELLIEGPPELPGLIAASI